MSRSVSAALRRLARWYTSATGLVLALGLVLVAVGLPASGVWGVIGIVGIAIVGVVVPHLFLHNQRRLQELRTTVRGSAMKSAELRVDVSSLTDRVSGVEVLVTESVRDLAHRVRTAETRISGRADRLAGLDTSIHNRDVDDAALDAMLSYWNPRLGIDANRRHVRQFLYRIRLMESLAVGRVAAHSEDIVIRALAARSVARDRCEILEIGSLFGVGGMLVRDAVAPFAPAVLTMIDPLSGRSDPPTGLPVTRHNIELNARLFGLEDGDYRLLEGLSTDDGILREASTRTYDVVIIDGDHSYDGVRLDFERCASLVAPGGALIIDDYGTTDWPDVGRYTDDVILHDERFELIGAASRTAVFHRVLSGADK